MKTFPTSISVSFNPIINSTPEELLKRIKSDEPTIVLNEKTTNLYNETYDKGTILNLSKVYNNFLLHQIANEIGGSPIFTQSEENSGKQTDEWETHPNLISDLGKALRSIASDTSIPENNYLAKVMNDLSNNITNFRIEESMGTFYINGNIKNIKEDSNMEEAWRIESKEFAKGNGTYYIDISVPLEVTGKIVEVKTPKISTEIYLRQNMIYFKEQMVPIIKAARAYADNKKLYTSDIEKFDIEKIISNQEGIKFSGIFDHKFTTIENLIGKFTEIVDPISKGIQKAVEESIPLANNHYKQIAQKYFEAE